MSPARLATYENHAQNLEQALDLYHYNLQISSSLLECLAVCEVAIRNRVANALTAVYGDGWAWNSTFLASLPNNARTTLKQINEKYATIDKIVPELPFFFWQSMFTARFDYKIWQQHLVTALPNANHDDLAKLRAKVFDDLEKIRKLRNRIAHYEPIFGRNLSADYQRIIKIIGYCCQDTKAWVLTWQNVDKTLRCRQ
ncbi:Abi family protein [Moraxella marmotae]|uniref:Abi family protein n=1 Tax=Moraxella marmotae TaxID=3344520 RepID=UPI0035F4F155